MAPESEHVHTTQATQMEDFQKSCHRVYMHDDTISGNLPFELLVQCVRVLTLEQFLHIFPSFRIVACFRSMAWTASGKPI